MKTSNKYVVSIAAAVVVLVLGGIFASRFIVQSLSRTDARNGTRLFVQGDFVTRDTQTGAFEGLKTSGSWNVHAVHGSLRSVTVSGVSRLLKGS